MKQKKANQHSMHLILFLFALIIILFSFMPMFSHSHIVNEPYQTTETYYETVPEYYNEEECTYKTSSDVLSYVGKVIRAWDEKDAKKLIEECTLVQKTRYTEIEKERIITKYRNIEKTEKVSFWDKYVG